MWNEQTIQQLEEWIRLGWSSGRIADAMQVTRNAVIGKVHRMGFSKLRPPRPPAQYADRWRNGNDGHGWKRWRKPQLKLLPNAAPVKALSKWITFWELTPTTCRWPSENQHKGAYRYCGCQSWGDSPYCEWHASIGTITISNKSSDIVRRLLSKGTPV